MLQAMNTGHDGSLTTLHANTPRDALRRLESIEWIHVRHEEGAAFAADAEHVSDKLLCHGHLVAAAVSNVRSESRKANWTADSLAAPLWIGAAMKIAVNVSARQFQQPRRRSCGADHLHSHPARAGRLRPVHVTGAVGQIHRRQTLPLRRRKEEKRILHPKRLGDARAHAREVLLVEGAPAEAGGIGSLDQIGKLPLQPVE